MCLGIPGQVVSRVEGYGDQLVLVDVVGAQRRINIGMLDDDQQAGLRPGDWVLIHMGFAIECIDESGADKALSGLEMMGRPRESRVRRRFVVRGVVQGVGFRPFVYVTATRLALSGTVANDADGVLIEVEGDPSAVDEFGRLLYTDAPPLAVVVSVDSADVETRGGTGFEIAASHGAERARTMAAPDVATCPDCLGELVDPANRRFRHPFLTCTNCGPRFTIMTGLPYDRSSTTMAGFEMCAACRSEYADPRDRRFHAQPIACHDCGPTLEFVSASGGPASGAEALAAAREALTRGAVVAVKGLGGYHLACDATNEVAVAELRSRKQRGAKPFAVMAADLATASQLVHLDDAERALLTGRQRPIVLLGRRADATLHLAASVAPGSPDLGVMLPYTPLHTLLFGLDADPPGPQVLVMTSANLGGEPIVTDDAEALIRLAPLADAWLRHDRPIEVPCDDSVVRVVDGTEVAIRRSRGYAPLPVALPFDVAPMLAVGGDLKSTCCLAEGRYAWLSQHIGDMDDLATVNAFTGAARSLQGLTGVLPERVAADAHPGYRSTDWARRHVAERALPDVRTVQHHHAHIAAVMGEHGHEGSTPVIGIAFDGTGYGDDAAVWGGEVLIADYKDYRRAVHLAYVPLPGGNVSIERPYRMALAHLHAAGIGWDEELACVAACPPEERAVLRHQLATGLGCVPTSSMGRLFDAVASLVGVRHTVAYEAQAAVELEGLARGVSDSEPYGFELRTAADGRYPAVFDAAPVLHAVVADLRAGERAEVIAARFHAAVAVLVRSVAATTRERTGLDTVALGGGVWQNVVLLRAATVGLRADGFGVLAPSRLPANDGGLALGQVLIAASG